MNTRTTKLSLLTLIVITTFFATTAQPRNAPWAIDEETEDQLTRQLAALTIHHRARQHVPQQQAARRINPQPRIKIPINGLVYAYPLTEMINHRLSNPKKPCIKTAHDLLKLHLEFLMVALFGATKEMLIKIAWHHNYKAEAVTLHVILQNVFLLRSNAGKSGYELLLESLLKTLMPPALLLGQHLRTR